MLGGAASGIDLSREIAEVCDQCYLVAKGHMHSDTPAGERMNIHKIWGTVDKVKDKSVHFDAATT